MAPLHLVLRILTLMGVKKQERDESVPPVRQDRQLVRDVLWSPLKSSRGGLGGQCLPGKQGQPQANDEPAWGLNRKDLSHRTKGKEERK